MPNGIRTSQENLGDALRQCRSRQHLSLRSLAQRTGYSPSFLSQVENGQSSPSLSSIAKITGALNIPLWELFQSLQAAQTETEPEHPSDAGRASDGGSLTATIITIGNENSREPESSPLDQFAYVLEGEVKLMAGGEQRTLRAGEAATLRAGVLRHWRRSNDEKARILVVSNIATPGTAT
jgi:transcriptional regulator with XRE-family HTH domain